MQNYLIDNKNRYMACLAGLLLSLTTACAGVNTNPGASSSLEMGFGIATPPILGADSILVFGGQGRFFAVDLIEERLLFQLSLQALATMATGQTREGYTLLDVDILDLSLLATPGFVAPLNEHFSAFGGVGVGWLRSRIEFQKDESLFSDVSENFTMMFKGGFRLEAGPLTMSIELNAQPVFLEPYPINNWLGTLKSSSMRMGVMWTFGVKVP